MEMPTKPQHARRYAPLPKLLRTLREEAGLTQRQLGSKLRRPQSWIYSCETAIRRIDLAEFCDWCRACQIPPEDGMQRFLKV